MSKELNNIQQWQLYADDAAGIAIEFDVKCLFNNILGNHTDIGINSGYGPIRYVTSMEDILSMQPEGHHPCLYKSPFYSGENEIRIIIEASGFNDKSENDKRVCREFTLTEGLTKEYIFVNIECKNSRSLPIKSIKIGPKNKNLEQSIIDFLVAHTEDYIDVERVDIPYR